MAGVEYGRIAFMASKIAACTMAMSRLWRLASVSADTVLMAIVCLYLTGQTINIMTLAGLTLALGPMIDTAIICLENTHRHLTMGANPVQAALDGAGEVATPALVATLCTFLVLVACWTKEGSFPILRNQATWLTRKQTMKSSAFATKSKRRRGKT